MYTADAGADSTRAAEERNVAAASPESAGADAAAAYSARAKGRPTETYPKLSGEFRFEIENNLRYHAQGANRDRKRNQLFATFEPELNLALSENLSVFTELQFEPVRDPSPKGENEEFQNEGIFVEQLYAQWKSGRWSVRAGKFEPIFGRSFEESRELFADEYAFEYEEFSEDTELTERLGGSVDFELGNDRIGSHVVTADFFDSDTSNLSRSAIRGRGRLRRREGGPSNSGRFKSFGLNLIGEEIPALAGFGYHVGFVYQDSGRVTRPAEEPKSPLESLVGASSLADPDDDDNDAVDPRFTGRPQRSYVAGLKYDFSPNDGLDFKLFSEYLYLDNADGQAEKIRNLLTVAGVAVIEKDLYLGFSYARRQTQVPMARDLNDYLLQTTVSYFRDLGRDARLGRLGLEVALRPSRDERNRSGTVGLRLIWVTEF